MLPTLAERLREQHARARSRRLEHQPWPVPNDPPTALLFQPQQDLLGLDVVGSEPDAPAAPSLADPVMETAAPVDPESAPARPSLPEGALLLLWALVILIDGALALVSLLRPAEPQIGADQLADTPSASPSLPPLHGGLPQTVAFPQREQAFRSALAATS